MILIRKILKPVARAILFFFVSANVFAGTTDLSNAPLVTSSQSSVLPNLMFVLDDSGSMDWDYLPDWANASNNAAFQNNVYNGVAYNPGVLYSPPVFYNTDGTGNTTTYPSMTSGNTGAWTSVKNDGYGVQSTTTSNLVGSASFYTFVAGEYCDNINLRNCILASTPSITYPYPATLRWCTTDAMTNCQAVRIDAGTTTYMIPRSPPLAARATITVVDTTSFTITVAAPSGATTTTVSGVTVNGTQILSAATASGTNTTTVATAIKNNINTCMANPACNPSAKDYVATSASNVVTVSGTGLGTSTVIPSSSSTGSKPLTFAVAYQNTTTTTVSAVTIPAFTRLDGTNSASTQLLSGGTISTATGTTATSTNTGTVATNIAAKINTCHANTTCDKGYSAAVGTGASANVVTITAPLGITALPTVTRGTGSMSFAVTAFDGGNNGSNLLTNITSGTGSYPFPGTAVKATSRVDCAGTTCTYAEEMTNYANWWAYYHTRMQMMKTSASIAFQTVGSSFRVGYATINANQTNAFLNLGTFQTVTAGNQQKRNWYLKLFAAIPNQSTPLRAALSKIGRLYAGKLNGTAFNGVTVVDPMQYSCQQNFTILSTDGYWNEASGFVQLDGTTSIGQQDGAESRPYNDGATVTTTTRTPSVTTLTKQTLTPATVSTLWSRNTTSIGAICTLPGTAPPAPPAGLTQGVQDIGNNSASQLRTWFIVNAIDPLSTRECTSSLGSGGIFACRGVGGTINTPATGSPATCLPDSSGQNWCVYDTNINGSCVEAIPGDSIFACSRSGNNVITQTSTTLQTQTGNKISTDNYATTTITQVIAINGIGGTPTSTSTGPVITNVGISTDVIPTASPPGGSTWTNTTSTTVCTAAPLPPAATSTPVAGTPNPPVPTGPAGLPTTVSTLGPVYGTPTITTTSSGGISNTLSDVSEYYYVNDLRTSALLNCTGAPVPPATTGNDVCNNDVPSAGKIDGATWQHMTTFTLGLGASGFMQFSSNYEQAKTGDYYDVLNGTGANPGGGICIWQASGACNWPAPTSNLQTTIDDLWHAAVNGRGTYFSATNPATLGAGLQSALSGVSARTGSSSAATTSNPNVTSGDNFVFSSTFTTNDWDGELQRQQLDLLTGAVLPAIDWSAQGQLDGRTDRDIRSWYSGAVSGSQFRQFDWATISAVSQQLAYFSKPYINTLSQFCSAGSTCLAPTDQTNASGQNLVEFIRGDQSKEGLSTDTTKYFRQRKHVLGDIVNAEAVYVKSPLQAYADSGFGAYALSKASRQGMVYVAANDGMLHAFNATTGAETWAYIPEMVLPNLYKLADKNYAAPNQHRYFTDGTPVAADVKIGGAWKTIIVAGLNGGGRGYYAIDVTNPAAPVGLWEFTTDNMGYTYGNPVITKLNPSVAYPDGRWVVVVTSGYNNIPDGTNKPDGSAYSGDGVGRIYVLDAAGGGLLTTISTGVGTPGTPSGLARISAWVDNATSNNHATAGYGGDMLGNVWRFDINSSTAAHRLATLYGAGTTVQPITTKPELGDVGGNHMVYIGTGRYLGDSDLLDLTQQSFYGIKDPLDGTTYGNIRAGAANFVEQKLTNTTCPAGSPATICTLGQAVRTSTNKQVNLAVNNGWWIDLPDSGERANTDPTLALGTLGFTTNIPNKNACTAGGYSYRYLLDYRSGAPVSTSTTLVSAIKLGNAMATRGVFVRLPNNTVVQLTRMSTGDTMTTNVPIGTAGGPTRRISWRELIQDQ